MKDNNVKDNKEKENNNDVKDNNVKDNKESGNDNKEEDNITQENIINDLYNDFGEFGDLFKIKENENISISDSNKKKIDNTNINDLYNNFNEGGSLFSMNGDIQDSKYIKLDKEKNDYAQKMQGNAGNNFEKWDGNILNEETNNFDNLFKISNNSNNFIINDEEIQEDHYEIDSLFKDKKK